MFDPKVIEDLAKQLAGNIPSGFRQIQGELEKNFSVVLQAAFSKMNLVSREEFDVQAGVLARTREKLETLEARLKTLEARLKTLEAPTQAPAAQNGTKTTSKTTAKATAKATPKTPRVATKKTTP